MHLALAPRLAIGLLCLASATQFCAASASPESESPTPPADLQQRAEDFQRAQQELGKRRLNLQRMNQDQTRLQQRLALANADLLHARAKFTSIRASGDAKELAAVEAAIKSGERDVATLEERVQAAAERFATGMAGLGSQPGVITFGDVLHVLGSKESILTGLFEVRQGGYIVLPRAGRVYVAGKDLAQAQGAIERALGAGKLRTDGLALDHIAMPPGDGTGMIYLEGEFKQPGELAIPATPTLVNAIIKSGGMTADADLTRVKLHRMVNGRPLVEEVNVRASLDGTGLASDLAIQPGDVISVAAFKPTAYVTGAVNTPGAVRLMPGDELGAFSAIVRSGGLAKGAIPDRVYILRDRRNGEHVRIPVNIQEVQFGKIPDVLLQGADIVVVPDSR